MSSTVDKIKERLDIQDVVSSYIKLEKAGKNLKAQCPFHNEKTPSFFVSPERDTYYCFGCGAKGDIFTFVEEFEGVDFTGALKILADRAGVEITYENNKSRDEKERLYTIVEQTAQFFEKNLDNNAKAVAYLKERGITEESAEQFRLGFAQDEWRTLYDYLSTKDYSDDELLRAGVVKRSEKGRVYDTFRSRIIFPIADASGRIVAFTGRVFESDDQAKYLNSPETPIFKKSQTLYALHRAKGSMRKNDFCIVVEGTTDVILSHQAGFPNTVAPLGTALTDGHLKRIGRLTHNVLLALDSDTAGVASTAKSTKRALAQGFDVKVAELPDEKDPADVIVDDPGAWRTLVRGATHIVDFLLHRFRQKARDDRSFKRTVTKEVLPYVAMIENKVDQTHFLQTVAQAIDTPEDIVREEMAKGAEEVSRPREEEGAPAPESSPTKTRRAALINQLAGIILWQSSLDDAAVDVGKLEKKFLEVTDKESLEQAVDATQKENLIFQAEVAFGELSDLSQYVDEMMLSLEEDYLREGLSRYMQELKQAEREGEGSRATKLLKQCQDIARKIEAVKQKLHQFA